MDEFLCSCCSEPIYVETEYWSSEVPYVEPVYVEPVYVEPVYVEPVYVEPVYVDPAPAPVYEVPAYIEPAPAYVEPVYVEPVYVEPAPAYVAPVSLAPLTAEIGGWEPSFTVVAPDAIVAPATVLANVPAVVSGYDPGFSLAEALASPSFGGSPVDTNVYMVYNPNAAVQPVFNSAPVWSASTDPLINQAYVINELALLTIRNASRPLG